MTKYTKVAIETEREKEKPRPEHKERGNKVYGEQGEEQHSSETTEGKKCCSDFFGEKIWSTRNGINLGMQKKPFYLVVVMIIIVAYFAQFEFEFLACVRVWTNVDLRTGTGLEHCLFMHIWGGRDSDHCLK